MRRILLSAACLALAGCMSGPVIYPSPIVCSELVPPAWSDGIALPNIPEAAAAPAPNETPEQRVAGALGEQKKWETFGLQAANVADQANGRFKDGMGIIERCEARNAKAIDKAKPKVLGIF